MQEIFKNKTSRTNYQDAFKLANSLAYDWRFNKNFYLENGILQFQRRVNDDYTNLNFTIDKKIIYLQYIRSKENKDFHLLTGLVNAAKVNNWSAEIDFANSLYTMAQKFEYSDKQKHIDFLRDFDKMISYSIGLNSHVEPSFNFNKILSSQTHPENIISLKKSQ